jgi:hypothetical protein
MIADWCEFSWLVEARAIESEVELCCSLRHLFLSTTQNNNLTQTKSTYVTMWRQILLHGRRARDDTCAVTVSSISSTVIDLSFISSRRRTVQHLTNALVCYRIPACKVNTDVGLLAIESGCAQCAYFLRPLVHHHLDPQ